MPLAIGIIMLGLGLSLTLDDFKRVGRYPRAVFVGLFLQTVLLPWAAFFIAIAFKLSPSLAVGLMLLAAAPGGATANIYSHLARGDVALNITLTAVNSILCLITLPIIMNLSLAYFFGAGQYVPPPLRKILEVCAIILLPVAIGMLIRARWPERAIGAEKPVRIFAVVVLAVLICAAIYVERSKIVDAVVAVGAACLLFNVVSMVIGYFTPLVLKLPPPQATAIAMEIGIHNGTLAIFVALNVLGNVEASIPPAIYSLMMYFTAAAMAVLVKPREEAGAPTPAR
nr:bile acid:sodium symporter family protein [Variibacter gotjawalensis]